jgi:hypothetical protein
MARKSQWFHHISVPNLFANELRCHARAAAAAFRATDAK